MIRGPVTVQQAAFAERHDTIADPARLNVSFRLDLSGSLDVPALEHALTRLADRHHALRTRFIRHDNGFAQEVVPVRIDLVRHDLTGDNSVDGPAKWCESLAATPFRLDVAPLIRFGLARRGSSEWTLVVVQHHLITDAMAMTTLLDELAVLYAATVTSEEASLPPPSMQPIDYATWQQHYLRSTECAESLAYWRAELDGADLSLPLPTDFPRPETASGDGSWEEIPVGAKLSQRLTDFARTNGVTLYSVLLTAYGKLLHDLTNRNDVTILGTFACRVLPEVEPMVGLASNSVALRLRLDGTSTTRQAISRTMETLFSHADHQELPFPVLLDGLGIRDISRTRSFPRSIFVMNPDIGPSWHMTGLRTRVRPIFLTGARTDLTVVAIPRQDGLYLWVETSADVLTPDTVHGWLRSYNRLLWSVVEDPDRPVSSWYAEDER